MSFAINVQQLAILAFAGLVIWAAVADVQSLKIPNRISVAIAALYPAYVLAAPQSIDWLSALAIAGATLVAGFVMFLIPYRGSPLMGAGDTKMLTACALWAGPRHMLDLLIIMSLAGGVIAAYTWLRYRLEPAASPGLSAASQGFFTFLRIPDVSLPYGLAICAGAVFVAISLLLGV